MHNLQNSLFSESVERRVARKEDMMRSMVWFLSVSMVVIAVLSTANGYAYDRSGSRDKYDFY